VSIRARLTGRDALDEATKAGSGGGSSALLEALIGGLGALVLIALVGTADLLDFRDVTVPQVGEDDIATRLPPR
jgi:hypothetical protein